MKTILISTLIAITSICHLSSQEMPEMPGPTAEHKWLEKFTGTWESESKMYMEPGKPPVISKATETTRMFGPFWVVGEGKSEMMGQPFESIMTFGYDIHKKKYVGTWVGSMVGSMWSYEGSVDESGRILTLFSEGHCPMNEGKLMRFKEVIEFKSDDHRIMTSYHQDDDGEWITSVVMESKRTKN